MSELDEELRKAEADGIISAQQAQAMIRRRPILTRNPLSLSVILAMSSSASVS